MRYGFLNQSQSFPLCGRHAPKIFFGACSALQQSQSTPNPHPDLEQTEGATGRPMGWPLL